MCCVPRRARACAVFVCFVSCWQAWEQQITDAEAHKTEGNRLYMSGAFEDALDAYERALTTAPDVAALHSDPAPAPAPAPVAVPPPPSHDGDDEEVSDTAVPPTTAEATPASTASEDTPEGTPEAAAAAEDVPSSSDPSVGAMPADTIAQVRKKRVRNGPAHDVNHVALCGGVALTALGAVFCVVFQAIFHSNRAACFLQLEHYREAREECDLALGYNPTYVKVMGWTALAWPAWSLNGVMPSRACCVAFFCCTVCRHWCGEAKHTGSWTNLTQHWQVREVQRRWQASVPAAGAARPFVVTHVGRCRLHVSNTPPHLHSQT